MKDKTQVIRILDVVVIAPTMIYAGTTKSDLPPIVKLGLLGFGIATLVYNGNNYLKNR